MLDTIRHELADLGAVIRNLTLIAVGAAIYTELRKPPSERTWHGRLAGVIPYDFRPPTLERLRTAYWNPNSSKVFTDRPLGVGWAVNVAAVLKRVGVGGAGRRSTARRAA